MRLQFRIFFLGLITLAMISDSLFAETVYLKNGETLVGEIVQYSGDTISIQTDDQDEIQQISTSQIQLVSFEDQLLGAGVKYRKKALPADASIIYLKNGEIVNGKITQYTTEFLTIESLSGHGVLQLPTAEVNMITSASSNMKMSQRRGIGYHQSKSTLTNQSNPTGYNSDQISYKFFLDDKTFGEGLLAFGNSSINGKKVNILAVDFRYGMLFRQFQNTLLYYGGSVGLLQVKDDINDVEGSGISLKGFLGAEMFFPALPNFGFSGELGISKQDAGDYESFSLSTSTFPAFSIHYYF